MGRFKHVPFSIPNLALFFDDNGRGGDAEGGEYSGVFVEGDGVHLERVRHRTRVLPARPAEHRQHMLAAIEPTRLNTQLIGR